MLSSSTSESAVRSVAYRFRCIGGGDLSEAASQDFRCSKCADLLEITYPGWKEIVGRRDVQKRKHDWRQRRLSQGAGDRRGVWRFPARLPALARDGQACIL